MAEPSAQLEFPPEVRDAGWATIASVEIAGKRIDLAVDRERLRATVQFTPIAKAFAVKATEVTELLEDKGILLTDEKRRELDQLVDEINSPDFDVATLGEREPFEVARGLPPEHGEDGRLDWNIDIAEDGGINFKEDDQGRINLRDMHSVINVREEDLLVTVLEPTPAVPGTDVFGKPIAARAGQRVQIAKGRNVRLSEDGTQLLAELEGHVVWKGHNLSVDELFVVSGNVDYSVGNVDFNGSVQVLKDVTDNFEIKARDAIEIGGVVGGARVIAGQNITIRGGVAAKESGYIEAGGDLAAKFLNNAMVDCGGNVVVDTQVVNSEINCAGFLRVPAGKVIGGKITAISGMELGDVGTPAGTRTVLRLTLEGFENSEIRELEGRIRKLRDEVEKIRPRIAPYLGDPAKIRRLNDQQREAIKTLAMKMEKSRKQIEALEKKKTELADAFASRLGTEITVLKALHPGVDVLIDDCRAIFNEGINGPVRLKANYTNGTIAVTS